MIEDFQSSSIDQEETSKPKRNFWKVLVIFMILGVGFLALFIRLFNLQVINSYKYKELAKHQHETRIPLKAERGNIYDRNGNLLASTIHSISFAADPNLLKEEKDRLKISQAFENALGIPSDKIMTRLNSSKGSFVWLLRSILPGEASKLDSLNFKAFMKIEEPKRNYLFGAVAAQVIGCTDIDNRGLTGIEFGADSLLKGKSGSMMMHRDAIGRLQPAADLPKNPAIHGKSVQFTIDIRLQKILEYELSNGIKKSSAASGTAIAMDPSTGEILAMATLPSFNPNEISQIGGSMKNHSISDVYEPGSTFKLVTAAVAIDAAGYTQHSPVNGYNGLLQVGNFKITDDHPVGQTDLTDALAKSSNIIFSTIANNLSSSTFYKYIRDFGFGLSTGIDLPGEVQGLIKKPQEMDAGLKRFIGFGYSIAVTPLQILNAFSTVANNGIMMKPHIIRSIFDYEGKTIYEAKPQKIRRVIAEETAEQLTSMLTEVVERGTGYPARLNGVKIAGKTGTSQQNFSGMYSKNFYTASFAGFFPAEKPRIALLVILDRPVGDYYGGSTAGPIFHDIAKSWLALNPDIIQKKEKHFSQKNTIPDLTGLFFKNGKVIAESCGLTLKGNFNDNDLIISQNPAAGSPITENKLIETGVKTSLTVKSSNYSNVVGLTSRKAIAKLHNMGVNVRIEGSGRVTEQTWVKDTTGKPVVLIRCR